MDEREEYKVEIAELIKEYKKDFRPIEVDFRDLVKLNFKNRATHSIHTYPAKLLPNIPYFFINNDFFCSPKDSILDPFSGSGTVMLEACLAGMNAVGADSNPLARLISKVKTTNYDIEILINLRNKLAVDINIYEDVKEYPRVHNIDYWFLPNVKVQLNSILIAINKINKKKYKDFFLLCMSNCVKKVSLADPRISVPVRIKIENHIHQNSNKIRFNNLKSINVYDKFVEIIDANIKRFTNKEKIIKHKQGQIISNDARNLNIANESIDLIVSSPPYAGAQKYIRSSGLNLCWIGLSESTELRKIDGQNIGREHYLKSQYQNLIKTGIKEADVLLEKIYQVNPKRAHIAANYLIEMKTALKESIRVLKKGKYLILVAANNVVCGYEFETQEYLRQLAEYLGMKTECRLIDNIKSYGLMTKRNKTASIITCEWILILKK